LDSNDEVHEHGSGNSIAVVTPQKMPDHWRPLDDEEETEQLRQEQTPQLQYRGDAADWYGLQLLLHQEPTNHKKNRLLAFKSEIEQFYNNAMKNLFTLWDAQAPGIVDTEYAYRTKTAEIEKHYLRTLEALGLYGMGNWVRLENQLKTQKDVVNELHRFEEMLFILQSQPLYLAGLAEHLYYKTNMEDDPKLFITFVILLFDNLYSGRCRHLLMSLIHRISSNEFRRGMVINELFDPLSSRAVPIIHHLLTHPKLSDSYVERILNVDNPRSLVSIIIAYTAGPQVGSQKGVPGGADESGLHRVIMVYERDFFNISRICFGEQKQHEGEEFRSTISEQIRQFRDLCFCSESHPRQNPSLDEGAESMTLVEFISDFLDFLFESEACSEIQIFLMSIFGELTKAFPGCMKTGGIWSVELFSPLVGVVLGSLIGGILAAITTAPYTFWHVKMKEAVRQCERNMRAKPEKYEYPPDFLLARVEWNIQALSQFLGRVVHPEYFTYQNNLVDSGIREDVESRNLLKTLHDEVRKKVSDVIMKAKHARVGKLPEDTIETLLNADLYKSHYKLHEPKVSMATEVLLAMNDLFHKHIDKNSAIRIGGNDDPFCSLVHAMMPTKGDGDAKIPWGKTPAVGIAHVVDEWHNFRLASRFLQFHREGLHAPAICDKSFAPVPRSLLSEDQRRQKPDTGFVALREFVPPNADKPEYELVEGILQELSGTSRGDGSVKHRIPGRSMAELRRAVEEKQLQCISSKHGQGGGENSFEARLDRAKHALEGMNEKSLRDYIEVGIERRAAYSKYLSSVNQQKSKITRRINAYNTTLKERNENLKIIAKVSHSCEIADIYTSAAQMHNERLAFAAVKRFKFNKSRKNPTPAQRVLEELKRESPTTPLAQLQEVVGLPSCNYRLKELVGKGVVLGVHAQLKAKKSVTEGINLTFSGEGEGFMVQLRANATLLKEFSITREDIYLMEHGKKTASLSFADELIYMDGFKLRRLLAMIIAEGAL